MFHIKAGFWACAAGFSYAVATGQAWEASVCLLATVAMRAIWIDAERRVKP